MANRNMEIDELEFKNELFTVLSYYEDETLINSKTSFFDGSNDFYLIDVLIYN